MLQFLLALTDESNQEKIEHIYNTYHDYMMKYAISKLQAMGRANYIYDAEDAVQNTFVKITRYIDSIDFSRGEKDIKNYCFAILNNEICNVLSDNQEIFEFDESLCTENDYSFIERIEMHEHYEEVVKAIEALEERYSATLYLVFCKEKSVNEIAEMMGISAKTVYTRLSRGKQLLLDSLDGVRVNG